MTELFTIPLGTPLAFIGPSEVIIVLVIALLVFGPQKLPEIGRQVGSLMREMNKMKEDLHRTIGGIDDYVPYDQPRYDYKPYEPPFGPVQSQIEQAHPVYGQSTYDSMPLPPAAMPEPPGPIAAATNATPITANTTVLTEPTHSVNGAEHTVNVVPTPSVVTSPQPAETEARLS